MIQLRESRNTDADALSEIYTTHYKDQFSLDLSNSFASILASNGSHVIGFGWLEIQVEATVILDLNSSHREKFEALKRIIAHGSQVASDNGFKQMHVFTKDDKFTGILTKHLDFQNITGDCLVKNLENGKER